MKRSYALIIIGLIVLTDLSAQKKESPYVILISFDGFRYDYVSKYHPPHFEAFIKEGSQATALIPSFPSKTFPNHYTLVTGLTPGHHGLVDNAFYDAGRRTKYSMGDKQKISDPYYYNGISLWQLARQNGMKSASYFWVGSELTDPNRRPDYFKVFNDKEDPHKRIDQTFDWLKLPENERPHLITLYFSFPDHEGHDFGPNSIQAKNAVLRADSLLGDLIVGLRAVKLPVNVILVSDHGMHELPVKQDTYIFVDELLNRKDTSVIISDGGTQVHLYVRNKQKLDSVYHYLKASEKYFTAYRKQDYPDRWLYKVERAGELLLEADTNHYFQSQTREKFLITAGLDRLSGVHGYDPCATKDVWGIFYANGPNVKKGKVLTAFQNIHVYPFIARILQLPLPKIDGDQKVLEGIYRKNK